MLTRLTEQRIDLLVLFSKPAFKWQRRHLQNSWSVSRVFLSRFDPFLLFLSLRHAFNSAFESIPFLGMII